MSKVCNLIIELNLLEIIVRMLSTIQQSLITTLFMLLYIILYNRYLKKKLKTKIWHFISHKKYFRTFMFSIAS